MIKKISLGIFRKASGKFSTEQRGLVLKTARQAVFAMIKRSRRWAVAVVSIF